MIITILSIIGAIVVIWIMLNVALLPFRGATAAVGAWKRGRQRPAKSIWAGFEPLHSGSRFEWCAQVAGGLVLAAVLFFGPTIVLGFGSYLFLP